MIKNNLYKETPPITRQEAERAFASEIPDLICDALVRISLNDSNWEWIQEKCLQFIEYDDPNVRRLAAICLGHLVRIHGKLNVSKVLPYLEKSLDDPEIKGIVEDVIDDIGIFLQHNN